MIFDTPHSGITFGEGWLSIPAGGLVELFGTAAAGLLAGTSPALEIRDTQPVANDPTRLTLLGKTAIAGLQLGPDTIVTASFEAVAAGGAELHATLRIECPEPWRIDDSFPGRPWSGPEGEALVGSLHLQGASFTVSNAGAGTPAGTARITFDARWQLQSALGVLASVAGQQIVQTTGDLVLPTSIGPVRRLNEGEFPWDLETRAAGLYLEATVGSIDLIPGSGEKASVGARAYVPLWYDPASGRAPFEPMLGYVGALSIPNGGRFVLTARSWGAQDDELIVKAAFEADDDSHHESALAHLMQGPSATEMLPEPIRAAISGVKIADVAFHFTADPGGVRLATTSVGLTFTHAAKDAWSPVPGFAWPITLTRMRAVILHGAGAVPTRFFGTAEANLDVCGATLAVTVQAPDFSVMAVQTGGALDPAKLLDTCLPGLPRPPLPTVDRLSLTIEPGSYYACSVSIHPDHAWRIDTDHGQYRLPDVRVTVSNRGWQFEARVDEGERGVPVFALAAQLAGEIDGLRGLTLPPVLEGLTIDAVSLAYTSDTRDFFLECEGSLQLGEAHPGAPPAVRATFTAALTHDGGKVASQEFGGRLFVSAGSGEPLEFELDFESNGDASILLAGFHDAGGCPIRVVDLLANLPDTAALRTGVPESLAFALHDAVFVFERGSAGEAPKEPPPTRVLLGLDVELGLELSAPSLPGLPLIGQSSMTGEPLRLALQVTGANGTFTSADVAALKALGDAARFLPDTGVASGVNLNVAIRAGSEQKALNVPAGVHDVAGAPAIPSGPAPADAGAGASGTQWMDIHRSFGPLRVERVGVEYQHGRLTVLLDAGITIAGLTVSLDGLSASTALKPWEPTFGLRGLGIDYRNEAIEIGGAFLLHQVRTGETDAQGQPVEVPGFAGFAIVRAQALTLSASGLFVQLHEHPSLFLYAVLDYEFGGPPFFFVTGLAAGFGYNRAILLPEVEDLAAFPLIAQAKPALAAPALPAVPGGMGASAGTTRDPMQMLNALERYVPPAIGESFLAVGVRFTSFGIVDSFALLIGRLSHRFEIDLLGLSTVVSPPAAPGSPALTPIIQAQLALKATFVPDEGILTVRGLLTPGSYLAAQSCQLSGGFAFYCWFKDREGVRAGDFVLTIGGYHPAFDRPAHYPVVPRLQLQWKVNDHLSIKGSAYFALTAHAVMAGGLLEAVWTDEDVVASFTAAADFLISWQPYYYDASVSVALRADLTIHAFGTHHLTFEAGANVHLWGPEFSGTASIYLRILLFDVSINVAFGDQASLPEALNWASFRSAFLPKDLCGVAIADGLVRTIAAPPGGSNAAERWIVDPVRCTFVVTSSIPLTAEDHNRERLAVGPMGLTPKQLESGLAIRVVRAKDNLPAPFTQDPIVKAMPAALWGQAAVLEAHGKRFVKVPRANDKGLLEDVPVGFTLRPTDVVDAGGKQPPSTVSRTVTAEKPAGTFGRLASRSQPGETASETARSASWAVEYVDHHQPALESGDYVIEVTQTVNAANTAVVAPSVPTTRAFSGTRSPVQAFTAGRGGRLPSSRERRRSHRGRPPREVSAQHAPVGAQPRSRGASKRSAVGAALARADRRAPGRRGARHHRCRARRHQPAPRSHLHDWRHEAGGRARLAAARPAGGGDRDGRQRGRRGELHRAVRLECVGRILESRRARHASSDQGAVEEAGARQAQHRRAGQGGELAGMRGGARQPAREAREPQHRPPGVRRGPLRR